MSTSDLPDGILKTSGIFGLVLIGLLAIATPSSADYRPQGDPPSGGSTTSGMRI